MTQEDCEYCLRLFITDGEAQAARSVHLPLSILLPLSVLTVAWGVWSRGEVEDVFPV